MMKISREWATPLTIGGFLVIAITGVLMFFHLDTPLNKALHEWLGWGLLTVVGLHVAVNLPAFKRHLQQRRAQWLIGACALLLGLSFLPLGPAAEPPPFVAPARALAAAPLPLLAQVAGLTAEELDRRIRAQGLTPRGADDSVASLAGGDTRSQIRLLGQLLAGRPGASGS